MFFLGERASASDWTIPFLLRFADDESGSLFRGIGETFLVKHEVLAIRRPCSRNRPLTIRQGPSYWPQSQRKAARARRASPLSGANPSNWRTQNNRRLLASVI